MTDTETIDDLKMVNAQSKALDELVGVMDSKLFKTLSEPVRIEILRFLIETGRADIGEIAQKLPQDRSVISRHLHLMSEAGLLSTEKEGRHVYYEINGPTFLERLENIVSSFKKCLSSCCPAKRVHSKFCKK
jgi:DNA-binding transcriptional ArsR family regulator